MNIAQTLSGSGVHLSCEVFPPKEFARVDEAKAVVRDIAALGPAYVSVTYGAAGKTPQFTRELAQTVQQGGVPALAHLTCASSTKEEVREIVGKLQENGIRNVLALRGDILPDTDFPAPQHFRYAHELIEEIRRQGDFCIAAACYPEGHVESANKEADLDHLKAKVDCGCSFLITQMFFDNDVLYRFLYNLSRKGITVPVLAGIMPITHISQTKRTFEVAGPTLTPKFKAMVDKYGQNPAAMKQAGYAGYINIEYEGNKYTPAEATRRAAATLRRLMEEKA